jgi:hypothetical protein
VGFCQNAIKFQPCRLVAYYLPTPFNRVTTNSESDKLIEFLHAKIAKRKKQIHPAHSPRFNYDIQLEIDCIEWALHDRSKQVA